MKKSYQIIKLISKEVHVPSDDYYARKNESSNGDINTFEYSELFDTENEAIHYLDNIKTSDEYYKYSKGNYIILPVYTV